MNDNVLLQRSVAVIGLLVAAVSSYAQITPATLGDPEAEKYFARLIEFPETHGDANVHLHCLGILKPSGRFKKNAGCYINNNWEPDFAAAVQKASKKAVLTPASDGKKGKQVGLLFQVKFLKKGDDRSIDILLNSGIEENVDEYGPTHISAQRVLGKEPWEKACPKRAEWLVLAKAHVSEEGVASSVDLVHGRGIVPTGTCQQAIIDTVTSSQFAPATTDDGFAVPSSYTEPFGN